MAVFKAVRVYQQSGFGLLHASSLGNQRCKSRLHSAHAFILVKCLCCYLQLAVFESLGQKLNPQDFDCSVSITFAADVGKGCWEGAGLIFFQILLLSLQLYADLCVFVGTDSANQRDVQSSAAAAEGLWQLLSCWQSNCELRNIWFFPLLESVEIFVHKMWRCNQLFWWWLTKPQPL